MIPQQIEVIKAFDCRQYRFKSFRIRVGEIGNYFEHADVYNFEAREGYVPYIERQLALSRPNWIKPL